MSAKRLHIVLIGVIGLLFVCLIGGAYGISNLMTKKANNLTVLKAKNLALEKQKLGFVKAKRDIEAYSELEKITKQIVPEDKSQAEAVGEIVRLAGKNGISLASITFPASTLGGGPGVASGSSSNKSLSQLQAVKNIPGVYQLQIVVSGDSSKPVPYSKFITFLNDLENNRRTAQVSSISLQPDPVNNDFLTFTLTLNEYIKP